MVAIYRGTGVPNFGQGAVGMFSAFTFFGLRDHAHWPTWVAGVVTLAASAAAGWLFYVAVMRKLRSAPSLARTAATLALLLLLQGLAFEFFATATTTPRPVLPSAVVRAWGIAIPEDRLLIAGIAVVVGAVLSMLSGRTRVGLAVRALADSEKGVQLIGLSPAALGALTWGVGFALAACAGVLLSPEAGLDANALTLLIVPVFGAALLARFSSFGVAVIGGLAIGMAQSVLQLYANSVGAGISELWAGVGRAQAFPALVIIVGVVIFGRLLPSRGERSQGRLPISPTPRYRRSGPVLVLLAGALWIEFSSAPWLSAGVVTMCGGLIALSLVLVTGFVGQVSLAQFAMAGVGGLVAARLSASLPFPAVLLISAVAAGAVGFVLGLPSLRVRGQSLALVTLGAAYIFQMVIFQDARILGGNTGYPLVRAATVFGHTLSPRQFAFACLIVVVLAGSLVTAFRASGLGRRALAMRENEAAAIASGVNVAWFKLVGFSASSAIAGLAGCLLSYHSFVFATGEFDTFASLNAVVISYIGGIGMVGGAVVAALGASGGIFSQLLATLGASSYQEIIGGGGLLLALLLHPDGVASAGIVLREHLARRRHGGAVADTQQVRESITVHVPLEEEVSNRTL